MFITMVCLLVIAVKVVAVLASMTDEALDAAHDAVDADDQE